GLQLHTRETALAELDSGELAIVPGDVDSSALIARVSSMEEDFRMPPEGNRLSPSEVATLGRWIAEGAEYTEHWAFRPRIRPRVPDVRDREWVANPIDAFVMSHLESARLPVSRAADPVALIRRVYYDMTGLPPTPEEVDAFLADPSPAAYTKVVDQLLASPHYGEQWGRHWLDLVRFAETNSFERDGVKPHAWRFRDYVIDAFNADKPYDQFVREQLAGDELEPVSQEGIIATGFYRLGLWDDEPSDPEQLKYDVLDDIVKTTSQVFLGLTLDCARCHDHKIDPIPQRDYYRWLAFFHNITPMQTSGSNIERVVFADEAERATFERHQTTWRESVTRLRQAVGDLEDAFTAAVPIGSEMVPNFDLDRIQFQYYDVSLNRLSDLAGREPTRRGRLGRRRLTLGVREKDSDFALVFDAQLRVPRAGEYTFVLDGDDGVRLWVDGKQVVERDGLHQLGVPQTGRAQLPGGHVPIRLEY
ncbi:MAG TPA: DUF1549 domain-containing protein, partial [Pirellulaceae bacterium]